MRRHMQNRAFTAADLVTDGQTVYHLALRPDQLARRVILVGDPDRVPVIATAEIESVTCDVTHRGLRTITGITRCGNPLSIVTTGMGTPSTEIVLGELIALNEIDLATRIPAMDWSPLACVRVGTSGGLQPPAETPPGTLIISTYAVGLDNTGLFYAVSDADDSFLPELAEAVETAVRAAASNDSLLRSGFKPYVSKADPLLVSQLVTACERNGYAYKLGITASNAGFFANQGRDIFRVKPAVPDIDRVLAGLSFSNGLRIENMEMESSFIFHLAGGLGYSAAAICPTVANRVSNVFVEDSLPFVKQAAHAAVEALNAQSI